MLPGANSFSADEQSLGQHVGSQAMPATTAPSCIKASEQFSVSQVRALIVASECCSFSKAASALHMSQPALSRWIKDMEQALGCELFVRTRHGVSLTEAGAAFLPHASNMVEAYEDVRNFVASRQMGRRQTVRVAASHSIGPLVQSALTENLKVNSQGAALQLSMMTSADVLNEVLNHRVEFGLCGDVEGHPDIRYTPVLEAQLGLIAPMRLELPDPVRSLDDLVAVPLVRLDDAAPVSRLLRREGVPFATYFNSTLVFSCLSSAMELMSRQNMGTVGTGVGASLLSAREFRFVPLPGLLPKMVVHVISARLMSNDDEMERIRDFVRASVHESPWHPSVRRLNRLHD